MLFDTVSPSRPDPCLVFCWGNPSLFGLGFPIVFSSSCTRTTTTTRTSSFLTTPRLRPVPVFVFVLRPTSFVFLVVVGLGLLWSLWVSLSLSRWFGCAVSMNAVIRQREGVAYQTAPPLFIAIIYYCFLGLSTKRHTDAFLAWRTVLSCKCLLALPLLEEEMLSVFLCVFRHWFGDLCSEHVFVTVIVIRGVFASLNFPLLIWW